MRCGRQSLWFALSLLEPGEKVDPDTEFSSIFVAGRTPADPPSKRFGPLVLARGGAVQVNSARRWGDDSSMTVDPKGDPRRGIPVRSLRARREVTAHTTSGQIVPGLRVAHVRGSVRPDWACATSSKSPPRRCNNPILRE
jgi:hypothetical protein